MALPLALAAAVAVVLQLLIQKLLLCLQHQLSTQVLTFKAIDASFKLPATFANLVLANC